MGTQLSLSPLGKPLYGNSSFNARFNTLTVQEIRFYYTIYMYIYASLHVHACTMTCVQCTPSRPLLNLVCVCVFVCMYMYMYMYNMYVCVRYVQDLYQH